MANCYQLVLLSVNADNEIDIAAIGSMILACKRQGWYPFPVYSSLSKHTIEITAGALTIEQFECSFDLNWDPMRSVDAIHKYLILEDCELQTISKTARATYNPFDFNYYTNEQTEEEFEARIRNQIFGNPGNKIVVALEDCVKKCLAVMGVDNTVVPAFSAWNVLLDQARVETTWTISTVSDLRTHLSSQNLLVEVKPLERQIEPKLQPTGSSPPINAPVPPAAPVRDEEFDRLCVNLSAQLKEIYIQEAPARPDPSQQLLIALVQSVTALNARLRASEGRVEEEKKAREAEKARFDQERIALAEQFGRIQKELSGYITQLQEQLTRIETEFRTKLGSVQGGVNAQQIESINKDLAYVKDSVFTATATAGNALRRAEEAFLLATQKKEGSLPAPPQVDQKPPFNQPTNLAVPVEEVNAPAHELEYPTLQLEIISVQLTAEKRTAIVANYGSETCSGYFYVTQGGEAKTWSEVSLFNSGQNEMNVVLQADLEPGTYEVVITSDITQETLCKAYSLVVPEHFSASAPTEDQRYGESFICKNMQNQEQMKQYLMENFGEKGLQIFLKLAADWKNPTMEEMNGFVSTLISTHLQDEESARESMKKANYQL